MNKHHLNYFKASVALAASGLTAGAANAAVIETTHNETLTFSSGGELAFDITGDGVDDYRFLFANNSSRKPQITTTNFDAGGTNLVAMPDSQEDVRVLPVIAAGDTVVLSNYDLLDESYFFQNWNQTAYGDWGGPGGTEEPDPIVGPVEGYVALAMPADTGGYNYGYLHVAADMRESGDGTGEATITLLDSAYETVAKAHLVGDITVVPEPSTWMLLVSGAAGVAALRRWNS
ncbi:PEP-CTERM sorting domain-containing protein [Aeoliella mucimassa]|uniref:PEP-CTERM motif protein n=1 Tax=Aeoliella mucimassa TaxID=2527972 RepID=A0A518AW66_9BACT|nr:PEP-CTERM sorting domain-containing protein [Aeoliella mucimassa]QDU58950.1 PEP-CTERM motif protein [Aeoliella mucimassa]